MKQQSLVYLLASVLGLVFASHLQANISLESKAVKKSPYYTGEPGSAKVDYISLDEWLAHRAEDDLPKDIYNRGFIVDDLAVVQPLYDISNRLLASWPGAAPKFPIFVRADTAGSSYGAETLIGNELLVFYGTFNNVESDDELAAILAHEIAHILLTHPSKVQYINVALQLFEDYEGLKNLANTIQAGHFVKNGENDYKLEFDSGLTLDLIKAEEQKKRAAELYYAYHSSFLGRPKEIEADLLAVDLLVGAGYSPLGLRDVMGRLGSSYTVEKFISKSLAQSSSSLVNNVQNSIGDQIKSFKAEVDNLQLQGEFNAEEAFDTENSKLSFDTFSESLKERLKTTVTEFAWAKFKTAHPVPDARKTKLADYLDENYDIFTQSRQQSTEFLANYQSTGMRAIQNYEALKLASLALMEGNLADAAAKGLSTIKGASDHDPYKRYVTYSIRRNQKNAGSAITNIKSIANYNGVPVSAIVDMIDFLVPQKEFTLASQLINSKEHYGYEVPELYPAKIAIALGKDQQDQAKEMASACIQNRAASEFTKAECREYNLLEVAESDSKGKGLMKGLKSLTSPFKKALTNH